MASMSPASLVARRKAVTFEVAIRGDVECGPESIPIAVVIGRCELKDDAQSREYRPAGNVTEQARIFFLTPRKFYANDTLISLTEVSIRLGTMPLRRR